MAAAAGPKVASVGNWVSPITSKLLTSSTKRLGGISLRPDGRLFWLEARPTEKGRQVLVTRCCGTGGGRAGPQGGAWQGGAGDKRGLPAKAAPATTVQLSPVNPSRQRSCMLMAWGPCLPACPAAPPPSGRRTARSPT